MNCRCDDFSQSLRTIKWRVGLAAGSNASATSKMMWTPICSKPVAVAESYQWYFFALVFLLIGVQTIVKPNGTWRGILVALCIVSLVCAVGLAHWSRAESAFLSKPDPEKPPA
jgi:hypothetical protein